MIFLREVKRAKPEFMLGCRQNLSPRQFIYKNPTNCCPLFPMINSSNMSSIFLNRVYNCVDKQSSVEWYISANINSCLPLD